MLLLTDGTVMCHEYDSNRWHRLTYDGIGNYVNGTWSSLQPMADNINIATSKGRPTYPPQYFASAVLGDGIVFVAGGEYNGGTSIEEVTAAEIYDPVVDSPFAKIGDSPSCVLPDGRVLLGIDNSTGTARAIFMMKIISRAITMMKQLRVFFLS